MTEAGKRRLSVAWHSIASIAKKYANKAARNLLSPGSHEVRLSVEGSVDGEIFSDHFAGELQIGGDEKTSTSSVDQVGLVALLLDNMPKTRSEKILLELPAEFTKLGGKLPEVSDERRHQAEALLAHIRSREEKPKRGAVRFQHKPAAAA